MTKLLTSTVSVKIESGSISIVHTGEISPTIEQLKKTIEQLISWWNPPLTVIQEGEMYRCGNTDLWVDNEGKLSCNICRRNTLEVMAILNAILN